MDWKSWPLRWAREFGSEAFSCGTLLKTLTRNYLWSCWVPNFSRLASGWLWRSTDFRHLKTVLLVKDSRATRHASNQWNLNSKCAFTATRSLCFSWAQIESKKNKKHSSFCDSDSWPNTGKYGKSSFVGLPSSRGLCTFGSQIHPPVGKETILPVPVLKVWTKEKRWSNESAGKSTFSPPLPTSQRLCTRRNRLGTWELSLECFNTRCMGHVPR